MTDREMLMMIYGALRAMKSVNPELVKQVEQHLFAKVVDEGSEAGKSQTKSYGLVERVKG